MVVPEKEWKFEDDQDVTIVGMTARPVEKNDIVRLSRTMSTSVVENQEV